MASKRDAKKLIKYLTLEVIDDCFTFISLHQERDNEDVIEIINTVSSLLMDSAAMVNHIDGKTSPKLVKQHFNSLYDNLLSETNESLLALSKIIEATAK